MKLYLDNIVFALQRAGGISVYWHELLKRMVADGLDLTVLERPEGADNILRKRLDLAGSTPVADDRLPVKASRYLPAGLSMEPGAVFHSSYYRIPRQRNVVSIVTVYDFTYEYFRSGIAKHVHHLQKGWAIRRADGIICISESTRKDLLTFFPGVDQAKVRVIPIAAPEEFRPLAASDPDCVAAPFEGKRYALFVGDRSSYKNFNLAVDALEHLRELELVVVGQPFSLRETDDLNRKLPGRHHILTGVDTELLNVLYNKAFCLIYPSSYEGFGIPIVEAMRAGCPVITTNRSSIPEVCGDAGLMVDDVSPAAFRQALEALEDDGMRAALVTRGFEQARKFSWDRTYRETLAFYREVHERTLGSRA